MVKDIYNVTVGEFTVKTRGPDMMNQDQESI